MRKRRLNQTSRPGEQRAGLRFAWVDSSRPEKTWWLQNTPIAKRYYSRLLTRKPWSRSRCSFPVINPASPRPYRGLPELAYPFHDRDIMVTACGRICMHRKKINISTVLAGQRLGIKEVDDGIWLVSFMHYDLGYIDLEQRTLQTVDNPFGTRLSPMS